MLRIALAEDNRDTLSTYRLLVERWGHTVACEASDGEELVSCVLACEPDLVIADGLMAKLTGPEAIERIWRQRPTPAIIISGYDEIAERQSDGECVIDFCRKPLDPAELQVRIPRIMERFKREREAAELLAQQTREAEERKLIERAKGAVMDRLGVPEQEAFERLRRASTRERVKLAEVARCVVLSEGVLR